MIKWLTLGLLLLLSLMGLGLFTGPTAVPPDQVWKVLWGQPAAQPEYVAIIWLLRLPRLLLAMVVGAALSCAGAAFQSLLRSPLADPYLTGTSAGASLGTALAIVLGLAIPVLPLCAFAGALLAVLAVTRIARAQGGLRLEDFLLAGVMMSTLLGSLVSLLLVLSGKDVGKLVFFLLGNLGDPVEWSKVGWAMPPFLVGLALLAWNSYPLNLLSLGEELAGPAGVHVESVKREVLVASTLLTACAVAAAGLVGFVGLVIPHVCRLWVGPDMRKLLPLTLVWGAVFLLSCDLLTRVFPHELPVGVVTALLGAPWFLWQLHRSRAC
ncbi:iron ABC transporter permease [bacterium]|nr:iron ABC transporter permease [bacterium]